MEKKDELPSTPTSSKAKGDSSPSPSPSPSQESEKTGHKRKRSDQSAAEVGSIMEDMRQAGAQDGITSTSASTQRPLGEGEAAFLSLVMQAANSEPIDDMSTEPTASLPDQLLESFIVRAVAEVMRREEEDLRRAIAASMAMTAAAPGASMDDHQMVLSEPMPDNPERAAVKVEPWVPAKTETPLTLRRLRPPWLDAFQEFQARGISLEECKAEVEHTWQSFLAEGTDKRAWTKVPPTVTAWEGIVEFVQERARETQEEEDRERKERREKRKKELEQLAEDAKRAKEEN
ncbi:uncharacterized protein ACA1_343730, partial [Acanthamoeba castellanii str. Neff]